MLPGMRQLNVLFACQGLRLARRPECTQQPSDKPPVGTNIPHSAILSLNLVNWQILPESFISSQYEIRLVDGRQSPCLPAERHTYMILIKTFGVLSQES